MFILEAFFNSAVFLCGFFVFFFFLQLSCDSVQSCLHNDVEQRFWAFFFFFHSLHLVTVRSVCVYVQESVQAWGKGTIKQL